MRIQSFPPLVAERACTLILGSMPGVASLKAQQYYAHPRNAFWPIMGHLWGFDAELPYAERCAALTAVGVAVWDVLQSCVREGSLDAAIEAESMVANDFEHFFAAHTQLKQVFFNGSTAEAAFRRHVRLPAELMNSLRFQRLPSTSPAHAGQRFADKLAAWQVVRLMR